jgi:hypothetical protein
MLQSISGIVSFLPIPLNFRYFAWAHRKAAFNGRSMGGRGSREPNVRVNAQTRLLFELTHSDGKFAFGMGLQSTRTLRSVYVGRWVFPSPAIRSNQNEQCARQRHASGTHSFSKHGHLLPPDRSTCTTYHWRYLSKPPRNIHLHRSIHSYQT